MKRTYADRPNWTRVLNKRFKMEYIESKEYTGFVSIICIDNIKEPLLIEVAGDKLCLADNGYFWTQHFPKGANHALTTMFDNKHEVIQWYFDICKGNKLSDQGMPYYDDLFLDVVVLPSGEILLLDEDELTDALKNSEISKEEYDLAYYEAEKLINDIKNDKCSLLKQTRGYLENMLSKIGR